MRIYPSGQRLTLEPLFCIQIDLLSLCNLLQNILNDYSVVHTHVGWCKLDVIV